MPTCDNCDNHVSRRFHRVFSDRFGNITACLHCSTAKEVRTQSHTVRANQGGG
jgi:hypothetical protein